MLDAGVTRPTLTDTITNDRVINLWLFLCLYAGSRDVSLSSMLVREAFLSENMPMLGFLSSITLKQ